MAYNPNLYMPYGQQYGQQSFAMPAPQMPQIQQVPHMQQGLQMQQQAQQPLTGNFVIEVYGRQGAESFPLGPNSKLHVYDKSDNIIYYIQTDDAANKYIQEFTFAPRDPSATVHEDDGYATKADLEALALRVDEIAEDVTRAKPATRTRKAATDGE